MTTNKQPNHQSKVRVIKETLTNEQRINRVRRAEEMVGKVPFLHLPGNPPQWRILFESHGRKIRVEVLEMVWNDAVLIDWSDGVPGRYAASLTPGTELYEVNVTGTGVESQALMLDVYNKAVEMYGKTPYEYTVECMGYE